MRRLLHLLAALPLCPVHGFREVVKDLTYRNDAEARLAHVAVAERQLEVAQRFDLLDDPRVRDACVVRLLELRPRPSLPPGDE